MAGEADEVILEIEDTPLVCKKQVLIDNSDYFKVMFEGNFIESQKNAIKLKDVDLKAMTIILELLSDSDYIINQEDIFSVLQTACMLQFLALKSIVVEKLIELLSPDTCLKTWIVCEGLDIKPLYLYAKTMSLLEFSLVKHTDSIMEITQAQLCLYLGNRNLRCQSELDVFQAAIKWWHQNSKNYEKTHQHKPLTRLLYCISFSNLTVNDIREIKLYPDIVDCPTVLQILDCIINQKEELHVNVSDANVTSIAEKLLGSKSRTRSEYPCVVVDDCPSDVDDHSCPGDPFAVNTTRTAIIYIDLKTNRPEKLTELSPYKMKLEGFKVIGYKELVFSFGGEHFIGRGEWNNNFWVYDTFKWKWQRKSLMPYKRRHFESCICNDVVYIIGGSGAYRISKDSMFGYSYKTDEWTKEIHIPCGAWQIKCFNYEDKLFLLSMGNRCGYIYEPTGQEWQKITFFDERCVVPMFSRPFSAFAYRGSIYLKGRKLLEFKIKNKIMELVLEKPLEIAPYEEMESVLSDNILYTVYKRFNPNETDYVMSFETYNVLTHEIGSFWHDWNKSRCIRTSEDVYLYSDWLCIFALQHYSTNETTELINELDL